MTLVERRSSGSTELTGDCVDLGLSSRLGGKEAL